MITHFEGRCDVCGEAITLDHDDAEGIIDIRSPEAGLMPDMVAI